MTVDFALAWRSNRLLFSKTGASLLAAALSSGASAHSTTFATRDLANLSLEQLSNIVVTSVSRREQMLGSAAASVYVIRAEDIRRSGATTLPEALRLAPNLQIARTDANQYAISSRGFNNPIADRLLVLVDGRTVYSPLFSGVFWDVQDVMLEDVERIEVISGPGATMWGANAVSGVINVITRSARDTLGTLAAAGAGSDRRKAAVRYGDALGETGYIRVYGKALGRENTDRMSGVPVKDASERMQAGFRSDWGNPRRGFTLQGDAYQSNIDQQIGGARHLRGANLLARWTEERADDSTLRLQAYYDRAERDQPGTLKKRLDIVDFEFQHGIMPAEQHWLLWGGGYRYGHDDLDEVNEAALAFIPQDKDLHWYHLFAQYEWDVRPDVAVTLGLKGEHNDYTGLEWLPTARIAWALPRDRLIWGSLSRAVRAPSRFDRELHIPGTPPYTLAGGPDFRSEISNVLELGYRTQPTARSAFSITAFHQIHDGLRSFEPGSGGEPGTIRNDVDGSTSGIEAWGSYRITGNWRLDGGWVELRQHLRSASRSGLAPSAALLGNDPKRWITLRSVVDITPRHEFDLMARYMGELDDPSVPAYTSFNARLGWRVIRELELSLVLRNLFDPSHGEWGAAPNRTEFPRSVFVEVVWRS